MKTILSVWLGEGLCSPADHLNCQSKVSTCDGSADGAGDICRTCLHQSLRHTESFIQRISSHQLVKHVRICSCRHDSTHSPISRPTNTIPSPGCELRGGVQEAGFRGMIDESVSFISKSHFGPRASGTFRWISTTRANSGRSRRSRP